MNIWSKEHLVKQASGQISPPILSAGGQKGPLPFDAAGAGAAHVSCHATVQLLRKYWSSTGQILHSSTGHTLPAKPVNIGQI
jgi:hypothetical protein